MIPEATGDEILMEIEDAERRRARVRAILECNLLAESQEEKDIAEVSTLFNGMPQHLLEQIPGEAQWDGAQLPFNRRQRVEKAETVIMHMYSGANTKVWQEAEMKGTVVVCVDLKLGMNVMDPHLSGWIQELARSGKIKLWLSGPPCRTVSASRSRSAEDGGPPVLRGRHGQEVARLDGISPAAGRSGHSLMAQEPMVDAACEKGERGSGGPH